MHQVDAENDDLWTIEGRNWVFKGETRHHAMRLDGSIAFDAHISESRNGFYVFSAGFQSSEKKGLIDQDGEVIVPSVYDAIYLSRTDPYAAALQDSLRTVGVKPIQIYPGSPWENGYNERFNRTLRREVLNAEWFHTTKQAQIVINTWLRQYNRVRPH